MVKPELVVQIRLVEWTAEVDYGTRCTWLNDRIGLLGACDAKYHAGFKGSCAALHDADLRRRCDESIDGCVVYWNGVDVRVL